MSPLISPREAYIRQYHRSVVVLDVRKSDTFKSVHLSRAIHVKRDCLMGEDPAIPLARSQLEHLLQQRGVNRDTSIILCDARAGYDAAYLWLLLKHYNFNDVSLIDGGIDGILHDNLPTTTKSITPKPGTIMLNKTNPRPIATYQDILQAADDEDTLLLDVRSKDEFDGIKAPPGSNPGRIKNSRHLDYRVAINPDNGNKLHHSSKLKKLYKDIYDYQNIIVYCQIGFRSAFTHFVLETLLGHKAVKNYLGSWHDYDKRVNR